MRSPLTLFAFALLGLVVHSNSASSSGAASPHDGQHLLVIHPIDWTGIDGRRPTLIKDRGAMFDGSAVPVAGAIEADVKVLHKGRYTLWFRVARGKGVGGPLETTVTQGMKKIHAATFGDGRGTETKVGQTGFELYAKKAKQGSALKDVDINPKGKPMGSVDDITGELNVVSKDWANPMRLEEPLDAKPFYWWHAGTFDLAPGIHRLRVQPPANVKGDSVLLDLAFLTTFDKLTYPFAGDVNAPAASYVRFRIDRLPKEGVQISAGLRIHSEPWSTPQVWCNPIGIETLKAAAHVRTGLTRWYRLQDILNAPGFGPAQAHLHLRLATVGKADAMPAGATQFAVFPHDDYVLREIDWSEPEGLNISMAMDFQKHLNQLRTQRDHAREHYEMALSATEERLFPLTRGDLYFGNSWGAATGDCAGYMYQTLRLLGINSVGAAHEPQKYRELYGWTSTAGHYWPPSYLPYDEASSRKQYDSYYQDYFSKQKSLYPHVSTFQIADEPGEILRSEMTAPLWRFLKDERGEKWADLPGNSDLSTRRCDLHDCVLEGKVEKHGSMIGFRVGIDNADAPMAYAYWHIGAVSANRENNLASGKVGSKEPPVVLTRPGAVVAATPTAFKIVYQGSSAALYLNGKLVHQHTNLPAKGGLGFTGGAKAIRELRLRPIQKEERLAILQPDGLPSKKGTDDLLDDLEGKKEPDWAKQKPLEKAVTEDWVIGGGMPEAHAAFRRWAQSQGLQPALFGQKSWADVRLLTVADLVRNPEEARLFYWSRNFSGQLTARMFGLAAESIQRHAANPKMRGFVALSGHSLYFPSALPLDMFRLAAEPAVQPGISDWMSLGSWFWDSHQAVAFSVAPYNSGARRYGQEPLNYPMMHCVWPSTFRGYTMLANQVRHVSYFNYGPSYAVTEGYWSEDPGSYVAVHRTANRAAQVDDVLASSRMRPSRVAMLYSMSNEYWNPQSSFADKRATFLALSHEYFQPELVTEEQVESGALKHYDALYVLEPRIRTATQDKIKDWVNSGGLLWTCADSLTHNEYNEPHDFLAKSAGLTRTFKDGKVAKMPSIAAVKGEAEFRSHTVAPAGMPASIEAAKARLRARYDDGTPAWLEMELGKGRIVYIGHRAGLTYTAKKVRPAGYHTIWADTGRDLLTKPLLESKVDRELVLSEPVIMASPLSSADGTVVMLYNMQPTPRTKLQIGLKESSKPHSVETFNGGRLEALPFEYRDGRVWFTLPELAQEQMVLVRRKPAPADPRLADMRQRTEKQLASTDAATLAAGAWIAGFHADWMFNDKLVGLLTHNHWEVRRAAAEALGRRGEPTAADSIVAALRKEKDAHVLGDQLIALARLGHPEVPSLCRVLLGHKQGWVRGMAVRAAGIWRANPEQAKDLVLAAIDAGMVDLDWRVRQRAIELLGRTDAGRTVDEAVAAPPAELADWADAISKNDAAFREYQRLALNKNDALLYAVAARRADPSLVDALVQRLDRLSTAEQSPFVWATQMQRSPTLVRNLFDRREKLPPVLAAHLTLLLENTFGARLGNNLSDWEEWLKK
ncbi:MAG: HEAT repeat domain-containing protein [Planctomycetes bacterium]|nr:HEAT repeat domain-containing protein [Planctomycetota bacterium]